MNHKSLKTCLTLAVTSFLFGCQGLEKKNGKNDAPISSLSMYAGNDKYIPTDIKQSVVTWKGSSLNGLNAQTGFVYLSKGEVLIQKGQLIGGTIEVDMNTIEDRKHERDNKLVNHLKDPDFFEVEKYPFSVMAITGIKQVDNENKKITANLTIKGITHPVTFLAKVEVNDGIVKASGRLVIDRSLWNVRYKSAKFYSGLADQTMSDSIELHFNIIAKK